MARTWYSLARDSAVLFERCYVNKWYNNDLALIGQKACAKYLKHIIVDRYGGDVPYSPDSVREAIKSIDLEALTNVLNFNLGMGISQDTVDLICSVNKYADIEIPGPDDFKLTKDEASNIQRAIETCKKLVDKVAPPDGKRVDISGLLSQAEGNPENNSMSLAEKLLKEDRERPYAEKGANCITQSSMEVRKDDSKLGGAKGFVWGMVNYLLAIIEGTPGYLEDKKQYDISEVKKEMDKEKIDLPKILLTINKYLNYQISADDANVFNIAIQVYEVLRTSDSTVYIREDWIDAVRSAAITARKIWSDHFKLMGMSVGIKEFATQYDHAMYLKDKAAIAEKDGNNVKAIEMYTESAMHYLWHIVESSNEIDDVYRNSVIPHIDEELHNGIIDLEKVTDRLDHIKALQTIDESERNTLSNMVAMYTFWAGSDGTGMLDQALQQVKDGNRMAQRICELYLDRMIGRV